jgi:uncharacterized protein YbjQ (UPF0145 family)
MGYTTTGSSKPIEGRIKFVIENLKYVQAVYEDLGYIQGFLEGERVFSPKVSKEYLRECNALAAEESKKIERMLEEVSIKAIREGEIK